jgi:hypothetical protein
MLIRLSKLFKAFFNMAIDWVVAAGHSSRGLSGFSVTGGGTGTDVVLFSTYSQPNMANTNYQVLVNGETAAPVRVDESTKTLIGFSVLGLGLNEVGHVLVHGQFAGMPTV